MRRHILEAIISEYERNEGNMIREGTFIGGLSSFTIFLSPPTFTKLNQNKET